ncbi:MAG: FYDLN acid domain-containing protein [Deltaproteobacteria bacterium]|nr:FYDLN acid domain-containing protein [Deltaproteobacteria bacterium]
MSSARKKTKAAKSTARKAPARTTAAERKTAKKAASRPTAAKTARPKPTKTTVAKAQTARPKPTKATAAKGSGAPRAAAAAKAPPPAPAPVSKKAALRKRSRSRRNRSKQIHAPASEVLPQRTLAVVEPRSKLGNKWECFSCGAKFYDLNKPEPLCPKCEANQLERPKATREVKPRAAPRATRATRAMAPLLDEDEDAMVVKKEELDLGVAGVDEAVTKFIAADEPEEATSEEEDEDA